MAIKNYEGVVILDPLMNDEDREAMIERLGKLLTDGGATLKETALWGKRRLAYPIQRKNEGFYVIYFFTLEEDSEVIEKFERVCRYDENIYRQMTVKVPTKKRGQEVAQLVPAPGYLADFRIEPRTYGPRRRPDFAPRDRDRGPRPDASDARPAAPAEAKPAAPAEAKPAEAKPAAPAEAKPTEAKPAAPVEAKPEAAPTESPAAEKKDA